MMGRKALPGLMALALISPAVAGEAPAIYPGPQEATDAFIAGVKNGDVAALLEVFGNDAEDLLLTGNPTRDKLNETDILTMYAEGYRFSPQDDGSVVLLMGADTWPFPIPIARKEGGWGFDVDAGREEVLFRRIGMNELDVIELMRIYVDIQAEFRLIDHDGDGVMEFASSVLSSSDARDGLFWATEDSPLGIAAARASLDGFNDGKNDQEPDPFGGYYFRVLTEQGAEAPGGAMDYFVNGNMVSGHALLAVPAEYGDSGISSFMVAESGVIYEADLGQETLETVADMTSFNPTEEWEPLN